MPTPGSSFAYNYAGLHLASQGGAFDVQHANMGMLEIDPPLALASGAARGAAVGAAIGAAVGGIAGAVAGGLAGGTLGQFGVLILALEKFDVPARTVGKGKLNYLQGVTHYPTKPEGLGDIMVTYRDFVTSPVRAILQQWFNLVYDEETGVMLPTSALKTTGHLVLFGTTGTAQRTANLYGLWPQSAPSKIAITYDKGDVITIDMKISVDRIVWEPTLWMPTP